MLGQRPQLTEGQCQLFLADRSRLVDVDRDGARVASLGAGGQRSVLRVNHGGVDIGPRGGAGASLGHAAELLEDAAPVHLVGDQFAQLASHLFADRTPLTLTVTLLDRIGQGFLDLALDQLFLFVGHFAPAAVVVEAVALTLSLLFGVIVLHDFGEVPLLRLVLGQGGDERAERGLSELFRHLAGNQTTLRQLALRNVGVDGQVGSHVGDAVGLELAAGAVFESQVEALVFEQTFDVQVAEARDEVGVDEHVDIGILDHDAGRGDLLAELDVDPAQDAGEEGLVEHHPQHVRAEVFFVLDAAVCLSHSLSSLGTCPLYHDRRELTRL